MRSSRFRFLLAKREKCEPSGIRARVWGAKEQKKFASIFFPNSRCLIIVYITGIR